MQRLEELHWRLAALVGFLAILFVFAACENPTNGSTTDGSTDSSTEGIANGDSSQTDDTSESGSDAESETSSTTYTATLSGDLEATLTGPATFWFGTVGSAEGFNVFLDGGSAIGGSNTDGLDTFHFSIRSATPEIEAYSVQMGGFQLASDQARLENGAFLVVDGTIYNLDSVSGSLDITTVTDGQVEGTVALTVDISEQDGFTLVDAGSVTVSIDFTAADTTS